MQSLRYFYLVMSICCCPFSASLLIFDNTVARFHVLMYVGVGEVGWEEGCAVLRPEADGVFFLI